MKRSALLAAATIFLGIASTPTHAEGPMGGATGAFAVDYLQFILDHHILA